MKKPKDAPVKQPRAKKAPESKGVRISSGVLAHLRARTSKATPLAEFTFQPYKAPPSVVGDAQVAMDWNGGSYGPGIDSGWMQGQLFNFFADGLGFFGYPRLAEMMQRQEYRLPIEALADECTREWIELKAGGDKAKADKVKELQDELDRLNVRQVFLDHVKAAEGYGMSHLFPVIKGADGLLASPLVVETAGFRKGSLESLKLIDPFFTTPQSYNSVNPLLPNFYQPTQWLVQGNMVDATRLLTLVPNPVPNILKPAYNFGGLAMSQLLYPIVNNALRNRDNAAAFLEQASLVILKTDMSQNMDAAGVEDLTNRVELFNTFRNNSGTFAVDKESEDVVAINRAVGGLTEIVQSSYDQICMYAKMPRLKLFGISPSGLNANSDGENRVWYDRVLSYQESRIAPGLDIVFKMAQLNIWGAVDPDITYEFVPLWQMSELEKAQIEKMQADTDAVNIQNGTIDNNESRERIATDEQSMYHGLDLSKEPKRPEEEDLAAVQSMITKASRAKTNT